MIPEGGEGWVGGGWVIKHSQYKETFLGGEEGGGRVFPVDPDRI